MILKELFVSLGMKLDDAGFAAADKAIASLRHGAMGAALAVGGIAVGLGAMIKSTAESGAEIARSAEKIGITTTALQELRFAARRSGIGAEELGKGLKVLAKSAYEATTTGGAAGAIFYQLGIQAFDATGKAKPVVGLLKEIADKYRLMTNPTEKAAFAQHLFAKTGVNLIPLLDKGGKGIEELAKRAHLFGQIMDDGTIKAGQAFEANLKDLEDAAIGLRNAIAGPLMRVLTPLIERMAVWIAANRAWLATKVHDGVAFLYRALMTVYNAGKFVVDTFRDMVNQGGALKAIAIGIAGALAFLVAPMAAVGAGIAMLVEDIGAGLAGKDSVTLRLLNQLTLLKDKFSGAWFDFATNPFGKLYDWAVIVFDKVVVLAQELPDRLAKAIGRKGLDWLLGGGNDFESAMALERRQYELDHNGQKFEGPKSESWFSSLVRSGLNAVAGPPVLGVMRQAPGYGGPGQGLGVLAPQFNPTFNINTAPGSDGAAIAEELGPVMRSTFEIWWDGKMRETLSGAVR